jgi:hypothetical protein
MFVTGLVLNIHADTVLLNLRAQKEQEKASNSTAPGAGGYKIPYGGLFEYVSCANYSKYLQFNSLCIHTHIMSSNCLWVSCRRRGDHRVGGIRHRLLVTPGPRLRHHDIQQPCAQRASGRRHHNICVFMLTHVGDVMYSTTSGTCKSLKITPSIVKL